MESSASWKDGLGSLLLLKQSDGIPWSLSVRDLFLQAELVSLLYFTVLLCRAVLSIHLSRMNNALKAHLCEHLYYLPGKLLWQILYRLIDLQVLVSCSSRNQGRDTFMETLGHTGIVCVFFLTDAVHMERASANVYKCLFVGVYLLQLFVLLRFSEWLSALEQPREFCL